MNRTTLARVYRDAAELIADGDEDFTCCAVVETECQVRGVENDDERYDCSAARRAYVALFTPENRNNSTRSDDDRLQGAFEGWSDCDPDRYRELMMMPLDEIARDKLNLRVTALLFMSAIALAGDLS